MTFGVVIPARNEEARLAPCLVSLAPFLDAGDRVFVVDDGSEDATAEIASNLGAEVSRVGRIGRALATAQGVAIAVSSCDGVLIAHADMVFPPEARSKIVLALAENPEAPGGFLGHRIAAPGWTYRIVEGGNRLRAAAWGLAYGDQALFVRSAALEAVGGFPARASLEDLELALRLRRRGPLVDAGCPVTIPPRHWERGIARATLRNWRTVLGYLLKRDSKNNH